MESPLPPSSLNTGKAASVITRRPVGFIEGDDIGLASVAEISVGVHKHNNYYYQPPPLYARICGGTNRRNSLKNLSNGSSLSSGITSPRSGYNKFYIDARFEEIHQPYFLEACYLCRKPLSGNRDIFMYRGDTPFCSVECRQKQIEIDESKEKNWNLSATRKALRNKNKESQKSASSSSSKNQNYAYRAAGTTVAAA